MVKLLILGQEEIDAEDLKKNLIQMDILKLLNIYLKILMNY